MIISGRNEDAVGKPLIYATSKSFMDYFGINSTADLPKINEVLMEELVKATAVSPEAIYQEQEENGAAEIIIEETIIETEEAPVNLAVTPEGEIVENKQVKEGEEEEETDS